MGKSLVYRWKPICSLRTCRINQVAALNLFNRLIVCFLRNLTEFGGLTPWLTGPRPGGSITAALFLKEFVTKDTAWAHIDIAGPVWSDKGKGVNPAGATGYGVRTLVNWVLAQS